MTWKHLLPIPLASLAAAVVSACDDGVAPIDRAPAAIALVSGAAQAAAPGEVLPGPIVVRVTNAAGAGVGAEVEFSPSGGSVDPARAPTDASGQASTSWRLGDQAGAQTLTVRVAGVAPLTVQATATAPPPLAPGLGQVSGDDQSTAAGTAFAEPLVVRLAGDDGEPIAGAAIRWAAPSAPGSGFAPAEAVTDAAGEARTTWTPPTTAGVYAAIAIAAADSVLFGGIVTHAAPASVRIAPDSARLRPGDETSAEAEAWDAWGNPVDGRATFLSGDTAVATVDSAGRVVARTAGRTGVVARFGAVEDTMAVHVLAPVADADDFVFVTAHGTFNSCALAATGEVYCWGGDYKGQLGTGDAPDECDYASAARPCSYAPVPTAAGLEVVDLALGDEHACALASIGELHCWGGQDYGRLGDGVTGGGWRAEPVPVEGTYSDVAIGYYHTCAIDVGGRVHCWGHPGTKLGHSQDTNSCWIDEKFRSPHRCQPSPFPMDSDRRFASITAGHGHTCGIDVAGDTYCWGAAGYVGDEIAGGGSEEPVLVDAPVRFEAVVSGGGQHTCGLTATGEVWCWGHNEHGELGGYADDCNGYCAIEPVRAPGPAFESVTVGHHHTCAIAADGTTYCWGYGYGGFQGGSVQLDRKYESYSAGSNHSCGRALDGRIYCTGDNSAGQLGTRTPGTPVSEPE